MMQLDTNRISTLNAVPLPILVVSGDHIAFANRRCGTFLAVDPGTLQNRNFWESCAPEQRAALRNALRGEGGDAGMPVRVWFDGGAGRVPAVLRVNPIVLDGVPSWLVSLQEPEMPALVLDDPTLTRREQQVLTMLAEGCTTGEMATRLKIAKQTVRLYVHMLAKKTGVRGRIELALLARRQAAGWCMSGCNCNKTAAEQPRTVVRRSAKARAS